jgi:hypothetical protein
MPKHSKKSRRRRVEVDNEVNVGTLTLGTVNVDYASRTANSATFSTVGAASGVVLASNADRVGLYLTNSSANRISLAFGEAAVLDSGITLYPQQTFWMDESSFTTAEVRAIASAASSNLSIQEFE